MRFICIETLKSAILLNYTIVHKKEENQLAKSQTKPIGIVISNNV